MASVAASTSCLLPEVGQFLSSLPVRLFIGGKWQPAAGRGKFETRDPGTGAVLADVAEGTAADIDEAVHAAATAFRKTKWATMPANDRAVILHALADLVDKYHTVLAQLEALDVGKPVAQAEGFDVPNLSQTLRYYADLSVHTRRREPIAVPGHLAYSARFPYGVCAFILPWNFPLVLLGWGFAPALAAGNTVVLKPAEDAPLSSLFFCRLAQEVGVPDGVINVVPGFGETAGAALAAHPGIQRMGFTGSPEVGRSIAAACGANLVPTKLELGGKGAAVVFADVNIEHTAAALASAITLNTGQVCCTATRWLIHESIWEPFVRCASQRLANVRIGHATDAGVEMGPLVSRKQMNRVLGYLEAGMREGAEPVLAGGEAHIPEHPNGFYIRPALLTGDRKNICAREEIFGPVAYLLKFRAEEEAIEMVNDSPYGLANSVWTSDLQRAHRVAESMVAGNSWINAHNVFQHGVAYAGCKMSGLGGGVLGPETLLDYLRPQSIVRPN